MSRCRLRVAAAAVLLGFTGCAFSLDGPAPDRPRNRVPECDTTKGLVALDGIMATVLGAAALSIVGENEPAIALLPLSFSALYLAGAVSGNKAVNQCREAVALYEDSYNENQRVVLDSADEDPPIRTRMVPRAPTYAGTGAPGSGTPSPYRDPESPAPQLPPQRLPPVQQDPRAQATPTPQEPRPQPALPQQARPQQPPAKAAPAPDEDNWSDFWREVP